MHFRLVYVREAHPVDGDSPPREPDAPRVEQPRTAEARHAVAEACVAGLELEAIPAWVDELDDAVNRAYAAQPDRLYLIGADGKVAWKCGKGPAGFDPEGLERAIRVLFGAPEPEPPAPPPTMEE